MTSVKSFHVCLFPKNCSESNANQNVHLGVINFLESSYRCELITCWQLKCKSEIMQVSLEHILKTSLESCLFRKHGLSNLYRITLLQKVTHQRSDSLLGHKDSRMAVAYHQAGHSQRVGNWPHQRISWYFQPLSPDHHHNRQYVRTLVIKLIN